MSDSAIELTPRQQRERDFYEEFYLRGTTSDVSFAPVDGRERRPWNPNWFVFERAAALYAGGARKLLEIGCGTGHNSTRLASIGYDVTGLDVSPRSVTAARETVAHYEFSTRFVCGVAERTEFPSASFDAVVGFDFLHHMDVDAAVAEVLRVLKPGGTAVFKEWGRVAPLDAVRRTPPVRWVLPTSASIKRHVTNDERKLTTADLERMRSVASHVEVHRFRVFARLMRFVTPDGDGPSRLEKLDHAVLRRVHWFGKFGRCRRHRAAQVGSIRPGHWTSPTPPPRVDGVAQR